MIWLLVFILVCAYISTFIPPDKKELDRIAETRKWAQAKHTRWQKYFWEGGREEALKTIIRLEMQAAQSYDLEQRVNFKFQADRWREYVEKTDKEFEHYGV